MPYYMGIDIGTSTSKGVIIQDGRTVADFLIPSGINYKTAAEKLAAGLLEKAGISRQDISYTVATGYGSGSVAYSQESAADTRCCARGIWQGRARRCRRARICWRRPRRPRAQRAR